MLDELHEDTDLATQLMRDVTKKTRELVQTAGGMKYFCIIIGLSLVLVVLTYMVLMS